MFDDVDDYVFLPPFISTPLSGKDDDALVYDWYGAINKTLCFDFSLLISVMDIEIQLSDDVPIASSIVGEFFMRNSVDFKYI